MELALILFIPVIIPLLVHILIIIFSSKWRFTIKGRKNFELLQNKNLSLKKATVFFKIATTIILFIPTLLCITNILYKGTVSTLFFQQQITKKLFSF